MSFLGSSVTSWPTSVHSRLYSMPPFQTNVWQNQPSNACTGNKVFYQLRTPYVLGKLFFFINKSNLVHSETRSEQRLTCFRIHDQASIRNGETTREKSKLALQWKSIIMSSLGTEEEKKTAYPYCLYIRSLDLTNLNDLFGDNYFKNTLYGPFFADRSMDVFFPGHPRRKAFRNVKTIPDVNLLGESITRYVGESADSSGGTAALAELRGNIDKKALPMWISRLPRLTSLTLWRGSVLDKTVADIIKVHIPGFNTLSIWEGQGSNVDADLASFFEELKSNTLRFFQVISYHDICGETFLALNNHHSSLRQLDLASLPAAALRALPLLKGCTALHTLKLQDKDGTIDLEATENDVFLEIVAWLTSCKNLKSINLENFLNGPRILTMICLENAIELESLTLVKYPLLGNQDFHQALTHQTSLESLLLKADAEDAFRDDIDVLVKSLCKLKNLKDLNILDTSDYFRTTEVQLLALHLSKVRPS
jgi:hypothetical protein